MSRRANLLLLLALLTVGVGLIALCSVGIQPRYSNGFDKFEFGNGRTLRMWTQPAMGDPPAILFDAVRDGQPLHRPQSLGQAIGQYQVQTYWTPDGDTSCTVAVGDGRTIFVYVDWPSGELWPADDKADTFERWIERRKRLTAAHPDLPADSWFP
jgi:hypothetical protein